MSQNNMGVQRASDFNQAVGSVVGEPEEPAEYNVLPRGARRGDWVEIWRVILPVGTRAPQVPSDTAKVPLEMRLRGFLLDEEAVLGQEVVIQTRIGREVEGRLVELHPRWDHDFGLPQPELLAIGQELRKIQGGKG
ncbi:MAG: 2-amino-4-oxopentanoate thiolase subunit OrtA [Desulfitobacteriaceae bacterium]|nr:2-amino-4-oxopentanoate thiolase subunit OrtA [Desulfitobacteriaceae bacterium]MDI6880350.1 2-amino-4-oxopentanoate thiolase subunit OrtA [Desulfitobacteriaceae bacterium]MDI6915716.1 2-amino-4-oxopentanoate thiolase subunit OrtA [Desulfitobacteriaceae bacterium]